MKRTNLIFSFLCLLFLSVNAQIRIDYLNTKKEYYNLGDTVKVKIVMKSDPKTCLSGMNQTKIFTAGCETVWEDKWVETAKGLFTKKIYLKLRSTKKENKLTVMRNTDKDSFLKQEIFKVKN